MRYDTQQDFASSMSWQPVDLATVSPNVGGVAASYGAVFDGQNVYFLPFTNAATIVRFRARGTRTTPTSYPGSP